MAAGAIVLVFGLLTMVASTRLRRAMRRFQAVAERATGEVVSLRTSVSRAGTGTTPGTTRSGRAYYPTVRFTTREGSAVTAESKVGTNPPAGRVGETVPILYDPADPNDVRIDSRRGRAGFVPTLGTVVGSVLVVAGIAVLVLVH